MKNKLQQKLNKKTIGIAVILITVLYLLVTTILAQNESKLTKNTKIEYHPDYLSYGDVWAFDSAAHTASNYSKNYSGTIQYHTKNDEGKSTLTRYFYSTVKATNDYDSPDVPANRMTIQAFNRFNTNQTREATVVSPADDNLTIPVMEATAANALYSVVPDTEGDYYVYAYSEIGTPTAMINYSIIDNYEVSNKHTGTGTVTNTFDFEDVGNNWYRAKITVDTVTWHAVALTCSSNNSKQENITTPVTGGQNKGFELGGTNYYNTWGTEPVYYNTVIIFKFTNMNVKLGPITKIGDAITITNTDESKGTVTAQTIFGDNVPVGQSVSLPHVPVIITAESNTHMVKDISVGKGNGRAEYFRGSSYIFSYEETSELSVSWMEIVNLPSINVANGTSDTTMNFFGAKTASVTHPAGDQRTYTFTADFSGASDLKSLEYSYVITDLSGNTETHKGTLDASNSSFSFENVCYKQIAVTFTATDKNNETYTATYTIDLSAVNNAAPFKVGSGYYFTWEEAVNAAGNNGTVILNNDYTMPGSLLGNGLLKDGDYVKASNGGINYNYRSTSMTFIVPHSDSATSVNASSNTHPYALETQGTAGATALMASVYRTLTVSSGAAINVSGTMAVGGTTNGSCQIAGAHANVHLEANATINVKARLSTCGYIYGEGTVNAENGSTVYMPFSILDFRGGGYTVGVAGQVATNDRGSSIGNYGFLPVSNEGKGISPFIRYSMNAIQSNLTIDYGAALIGYVDLYADGAHNNANANIIGSNSGLIIMSAPNGKIKISYDADQYVSTYSTLGKTKIRIEGDARFGNLTLRITSPVTANINTKDVNFPIPYNFDIEIASSTFTVPYSVMLLPGASVTVAEGATLNVQASLTVYDGLHDYTAGPNTAGRAILPEYASESQKDYVVNPDKNYPTTADLRSATFGGSGSADLIVNGTLNLESGAKIGGIIQTSSSGAAKIIVDGNVTTSTNTQVGAVGNWTYSAVIVSRTYYFAGATVRELKGQIIDTGTGERVNLVPGKTYSPSAGAANISSYTYTLYYDSTTSNNKSITEEVACILQGSWYNYEVEVYTVDLNGQVSSEPTMTLYFAHGADVSAMFLTTDKDGNNPAKSITSNAPLYFNVKNAQAKIVWADGGDESYYPLVRNAVTNAVNKGDRVVLLKDILDFSTVIGPSADQDFIFDVNEHTINYRSTPFASNAGGRIVIDVNRGTITNVVDGIPYDNPVLLVDEGSYLELLLNGGTINVTGSAARPLTKSSTISNTGTLVIDLGGGTWEYLTGLEVKKSNAAANQTHDYTALANYRGLAAITNAGTLTIKDSSEAGNGKFSTDLIQDSNTLTPATPTTNYVSVIRNNAGATLYLDGGTLELITKTDEKGEPILSTAATHVPLAVYSSVVLNFGDIRSHDTGSAVSMTTSGGHALYNFVGGTVDLDLRGGTIALNEYADGIAINPAMYSKSTLASATIVNDGVMTLRDSTKKGTIRLAVSTTGSNLAAVRNGSQTNGSIVATLTLDGVNIETTQELNNNTYALYNGNGNTIVSINNTHVTAKLGYAVNIAGSAAVPSSIGDITNSTFEAGTTDSVAGTHGFYTAFTTIGNITGSTFKNASTANNMMAFRVEGNAATLTKVGNITDSRFDGAVYGFYGSYVDVGEIKGSTFIGGTNYALAAISYSTIKSITGGEVATREGGSGGGLSLTGTAASATSLRLVSTIPGGITGTKFSTAGVAINLSHARIGNLNGVKITTTTGNGITSAGGSIIGDIIGCEFDTGAIGLSSASVAINTNDKENLGHITGIVGNIINSTFKTKTQGISITGQAATAAAERDLAIVGDITGSTFDVGTIGFNLSHARIGNLDDVTIITAGGNGITATNGSIIGDIIGSEINSTAVGLSTTTFAATAAAPLSIAPEVGNITGTTINAGTQGISISGAAANTYYADMVFATVGDITGCEISSGTQYGIYLTYTKAGKIEGCAVKSATTTNNYGAIHVINLSEVELIKDTKITIAETSTSTSAAGIYTSAATIGDIIHCEITAAKGPAISHNATAALGVSTIGDITNCTIVSGAGGIVGAGGVATATAQAAAPVIGDITGTTFETVTYGISIGSAAANTYDAGAGAVVGNITGCTFDVGSYGIQIAGGAGTAAENYADVGFAKVGDITGTTVNSGTYSIYLNYCKGGVIEDCALNATNPAANSYVIGNANGSYIKHIKDTPITVTAPSGKSYGIYNNGGEIDLIEKSPIDAPYGIYNLNVRANTHTSDTGSTISYYGHIGTIKDMEVSVAQWALQNRGVIDEIVGKCTFIAANPSAQVPWDHGTIANGNAAANTFINYNTWWGSDGNSTIWKQTDTYDDDGNLTRTVEYKWDDKHMPTIGKISGDIKIIAENTSNNTGHGVAMINNGIIGEISGNVDIETYVHPDNTVIAYSSYGIQNTSGGRIDKIVGNVKISAGAYAIQNSTGQLYITNRVTYAGGTATSGQETEIYRTYYHDYDGIGEITGDMSGRGIIIEATDGSYALENHARIGNITGKVRITADKGSYAIQNTTGTTINIIQTMSWAGTDDTPKIYHQEYVMATIGTIGGGNSEIMISSNGATNNTYTLQNNGRIEAILEGVTIKDLTGYTGMPTVFNSEGSYTALDYTYSHLRYDSGLNRYYTKVTRDYVYEQPYIGEIRGVTVTTQMNYALRNTGVIGSITNSSFTAATGYGIDNTLSYAAAEGSDYARETVQVYYGTTPLAVTTNHLGETTIWFNRDQATIEEIDHVTITVESGNYGIQNAGIIDSITNSTITVKAGNYAIGNSVRAATGEDVSMMKDYIYLNDAGNYVATATADITDKVWSYAAPVIRSIGAGNIIEAVSQTIYNTGHIDEIGSATGARTTITATGGTATTQYAIYNYRGLVTHQKRDNSTVTVDTNTGAIIDIIHNVSISSQNSVAIYNGDGTTAFHPSIGEIAEGTEVASVGANAVYNHATNSEIVKITGGIFTTGEGNYYALYNNSTAFPIELSGGYFKGGADDRGHAIYKPDEAARYTYPEDMSLSQGKKDVTRADGTTATAYYYITENVIVIIFDGNSGKGEMEPIRVSLADGKKDTPLDWPKCGFTYEGYDFLGWAAHDMAGEAGIDKSWAGTIGELIDALEKMGLSAKAGDEITLYAVWRPNEEEIQHWKIDWGAMSFTYTRPVYKWNASTMQFELQNPDEYGWHADKADHKIAVTVEKGYAYEAQLKYENVGDFDLGMIFTGVEGTTVTEDNKFTVSDGGTAEVEAMLDKDPGAGEAKDKQVGTITIVFEKVTTP